MHDESEAQITANALRSLENVQNPRLKRIMTSLITHLHAFVRDVELTEAEWFQGIQFLTRTGQMCDDRRQEFILLSDTLGVSMLVDAINHRTNGVATASTVLGPFYREGAAELPYGASISKDGRGEPAVLTGRVLSTDGTPIAGAVLDVWEANEQGLYEQQDPNQPEMNLRGRFRTDEEGRYKIVAIKPVSYSIPDDGPVGQMLRALGRHPYRPAHIHFIVSAPGHRSLVTHLFVEGDPYLESDVVFGTKESLVVPFVLNESAEEAAQHGIKAPFWTVHYDFVLMPA
ncbi:MAG: intradiol ring-cleavage dioxygenase [Roseiflexaceae bacterium]|nr:intradiol ring-cleavage dioxygenase [Roseiflexus sp.]MDW8212857.1 intradiol ring-cleavage dioxygenase [Roseiflexaceae bacterium]